MKLLHFFGAALVALLLVGCSDPGPSGRTVIDDAGRSVSVPESPGRIVSLSPSTTELAFAAGLGNRIVGVTTADDYPPAIDNLEKLAALPLNHEAVVALAPDLILASDQINSPRDAEALEELGIPTYFVSIESLADVSRSIRALGSLFGTPDAAIAYADSLEQTLFELDSLRGEDPDRPSVIFLIGDDQLYSFGRGSYVHDMIATAGGRSLTEDLETKATVLSEEFVIHQAPDVVLTAFDADIPRLLSLHPAWSSVPALVNANVFRIAPDSILRPGPRLIAGTKLIMDVLAETQ